MVRGAFFDFLLIVVEILLVSQINCISCIFFFVDAVYQVEEVLLYS